ncbi:MAG: 30S ribosomal protein S8 [Victivallales bacterium]|nr:30S ribosomal protein S8 [Victivallales bacterium]
MSMSDPIADMLTRVRNAGAAGLTETTMPGSKMKAALAQVLKETGYVGEFSVATMPHGGTELTVEVRFVGKENTPVIEGLQRISKPSRRVYVNSREIPRVLGGLGVAVLSTSQGLMTGRDARQKNIGGEVLCYVW